ALACEIEPDSRMNPVLLKPQGGAIQVVIRGKVWKTIPPFSLYSDKAFLGQVIGESFESLCREFDLVVVEGMGSPAELNLKEQDLANMGFALRFRCPVILVGDIERGGVFASLYGTWAIFTNEEKTLLKGFVINKLHGGKDILQKGVEKLELLTSVGGVGVIPYHEFILDDEDSFNLKMRKSHTAHSEITIGVLHLPHMANTSDFQPLLLEEDVALLFVPPYGDLTTLDLLIIPGTKNTMEDLILLHEYNFQSRLRNYLARGGVVLGICGGFQMLGISVRDPWHLESSRDEVRGFSILDVVTELDKEKTLRQVEGVWSESSKARMEGYEIHHGRTTMLASYPPLFLLDSGEREGITWNKQVFGTYCHGLFDHGHFRRSFLNFLREKRGLPPILSGGPSWKEKIVHELDTLADFLQVHLDFQVLQDMIGC
ncbi:MAG: cobyric acid synthase, partial [Atribacterota bacterium]|nr:cobyric acid synthase [Atribacterota bacterium]